MVKRYMTARFDIRMHADFRFRSKLINTARLTLNAISHKVLWGKRRKVFTFLTRMLGCQVIVALGLLSPGGNFLTGFLFTRRVYQL